MCYMVLTIRINRPPPGAMQRSKYILVPYECRIGNHVDKFVLIYLNDLVFSNSAAEHEQHFQLVLQHLREHRLQAKLRKCEFGKPKVKYLGHVVGSGELSMDPDMVLAVLEWEPPTDVKHVQ